MVLGVFAGYFFKLKPFSSPLVLPIGFSIYCFYSCVVFSTFSFASLWLSLLCVVLSSFLLLLCGFSLFFVLFLFLSSLFLCLSFLCTSCFLCVPCLFFSCVLFFLLCLFMLEFPRWMTISQHVNMVGLTVVAQI